MTRARGRRLLLLLVASATVWACTGPGSNKPVTPPDTAVPNDYSEQRYAGEAVSGSAVGQTLFFSVSRVIALGTTAVSTAFAPPRPMWVMTVGPGPTNTIPPDPTPFPTPPPPMNDYSDTDGDGIPNNTLLGMTNATLATTFGSGGLNGYILTSDLSPAVADGQFRGLTHLELAPLSSLPFGWSAATANYDTEFDVAPGPGGPGVRYEMTSLSSDKVVFTSGTASHVCISQTQYLIAYSPTGPYTPGKPLVDGTMTVSGTAVVNVDGRQWPVNLATTTDLTISAGCVPGLVTGGRMDLAFGTTGGTMSAHWTGCGAMTVETPAPSPTP